VAESRDFFRAAVFFLIKPDFTALSSALYTSESEFVASCLFLSAMNFLRFFIARVTLSFRRRLKIRRRALTRKAFFADLIIGMAKILTQGFSKSNMSQSRNSLLPPENPVSKQYF